MNHEGYVVCNRERWRPKNPENSLKFFIFLNQWPWPCYGIPFQAMHLIVLSLFGVMMIHPEILQSNKTVAVTSDTVNIYLNEYDKNDDAYMNWFQDRKWTTGQFLFSIMIFLQLSINLHVFFLRQTYFFGLIFTWVMSFNSMSCMCPIPSRM
jgi:hypothetical protein